MNDLKVKSQSERNYRSPPQPSCQETTLSHNTKNKLHRATPEDDALSVDEPVYQLDQATLQTSFVASSSIFLSDLKAGEPH